ncbi:MAG: ShlB/FhaC/HecB family hemolysin secretion/activation protein [Candidatus Omnitrophica bacterium]|nr:ShlB/FhaC/HecB family hemolysin secretion/activation protein [Candidatus Omnitrophota bacterium]
MPKIKNILIGAVLCAGFLPWPAFADDRLSEEAQNQISSQADLLREETRSKQPRKEAARAQPYAPKELPPLEEEKGPEFSLRQIRLEGNRVFSDKELSRFLKLPTDGKLFLRDLRAMAREITSFYQSQGYTTSRAYLSEKDVESGVATLHLLEGKVGKVEVTGNRYFRDRVYRDGIHLGRDRVFRSEDLENSLYFLKQKPDILDVKAEVLEAEEPGVSDIFLKAEDSRAAHLYFDFNNHGTKLTHRSRFAEHFDHNNFLGHGDILNTAFVQTQEGSVDGASGFYSFPFEQTGTTLSFGTSYAKIKLVKYLRSSEVKGNYLSFSPGLTQSLVKKQFFTADAFVGLDVKDSKTDIDDLKSSFDRMRVLKAGPQFSFEDPAGKNFLSGHIHQGLPSLLNSSKENDSLASRFESGGKFTYYTAEFTRLHRLPHSSFLVLKAGGQWTRDSLTAVEVFRAGGAGSVRGYAESDSVGDYGYLFSSELNIPTPFIPSEMNVPFTHKKWGQALRWVGFLDGGNTYVRERSRPTVVKNRSLLGAGFGVRVDLDYTFSLQLDFGWPVGDKPFDAKPRQLYLALKAGF